MNETETRATYIDPALKQAGWGIIEDSRIRMEFPVTKGRLIGQGQRSKALSADYVLQYRNRNLAVIEAKRTDLDYTEGVSQAKDYAERLHVRFTYSTNGLQIYCIDMQEGKEGDVSAYPTPDELWAKTFEKDAIADAESIQWRDKLLSIPFEDRSGTWQPRYYQENAITKSLEAIAKGQNRILLTLATGTGKTAIAFQIAWKLFHSKWNINRDGLLSPRILFLADRNILADQAFNAFSAFEEDALVRISPDEIRKKKRVPKNGNIFFTIFQTFMSGGSTSSPTTQKIIMDFVEIDSIDLAKAYMYILECADGSFYTCSTKNLKLRVFQHKNGEGAEYTKSHNPVKLVYYETFDRIDKAFKREKQIQKWSRAKKIALIQNDLKALKELSNGNKKFTEPVEVYFGEYPKDFFDFIIIDECHRGGANDESNWRAILEYFSPAVQLGLTATPKRNHNVDTYKYFGDPVYIYSLKEGINDGFLTPFKVKQIDTTIDEYLYTPDDDVEQGEIEEGKIYTEDEFNTNIEIKAREEYRVKLFMDLIDQNEKTLVFCARQSHALLIRNIINQLSKSKNPNYCKRVTADEGKLGEQHLRDFQDNEKTIPTILTTSHKLSTGVDTPEVRNIVLLRPIRNLIEFKQIIGRGTRLYDNKDYFTIYDFVEAYHHFSDEEWDGEPIEPEQPKPYKEPDDRSVVSEQPPSDPCPVCGYDPCRCDESPRKMIKVRLSDGKVRELQHMVKTSFWSPDGKPISAEEFLLSLFGSLPGFFKNEDQLRQIWSHPDTRKKLLNELNEKGYTKSQLRELQTMIQAEKSDLYDVLAYIAFKSTPIDRTTRAEKAKVHFNSYDPKQQEFLNFVLKQYINSGVDELDDSKLPDLLELKYNAITDAKQQLGDIASIRNTFIGFQEYLYEGVAV